MALCAHTCKRTRRERKYRHRTSDTANQTVGGGMTVSIRLRRFEAARQPTEMPRNAASSTMLVKKVRKTTVLANQRMHASSMNRIRKLTRNRSAESRADRVIEASGLYPRR